MVKLIALALVLVLPALLFAQEAVAPDTANPAAAAAAAQSQPAAAAMESDLSLESAIFCTGVEEREPVGEASEFSADVGTVYFWSNILNDGEETTVEHVWYLNGEEKARVTLPAKYPRNRIWSSKIIPPEWDGEWKVEIVSDGQVLGAKICTVK